ncbi:YibE/F family protein [Desulfogranum japonicum]|uniref:YibE/F family protein n=1 Tax=Desulfogranum japonicum TaxID=231447 RepID=UPI0003F5D808|nr:YibE/F family protein [Desulfogranum japonicum]
MFQNFFSYTLLLLLTLAGIFGYYHYTDTISAQKDAGILEVKAKVISIDNSDVRVSSLSSLGTQELEVQILEGRFKNRTLTATYNLIGQMDLENNFKADDTIIVAIITDSGKITHVKAVELYRQDVLIYLFAIFVLALLLYAGTIGIKALISFVLTVFILWEFLIKLILAGHDPIQITSYTLMLLSGVIIFLVAGFNRKGTSAFLGTLGGLFITLGVTFIFGDKVGLHGLTQPYVTVLLFSGYSNLNIQEILYSAILLGASGAAMDIAMDIAASMDEIYRKKPEIKPIELMQSGFTVGRHVIGTMATTLLLAYSGGYFTLLMVFRIKEPSIMRMINLKIVAAEIVRTLIGSIGLVLVAPLTAIIGAVIITGVLKPLWRLKKPVLPIKNQRASNTAIFCADPKE